MEQTAVSFPANAMAAAISGIGESGVLLVRIEGQDDAVHPVSVPWSPVQLDWAKCSGLRCAVTRLGNDLNSLLLIGLLDAPPPSALASSTLALNSRMEACESLVLQCGKARIALRADGRIEILAGEIVSRARGTHRIQGGSVQIN